MNSRPIQEILNNLNGVVPNGEGSWMALCPCHNDTKPSLSITESDDGKTLVKCFAGCDQTEVYNAVVKDSQVTVTSTARIDATTTEIEAPAQEVESLSVSVSDGDNVTTVQRPKAKTKKVFKLVSKHRYTDADGAYLYTKQKKVNEDKEKTYTYVNRDGGYTTKGFPNVLYNLPPLIKAESVVIVEGEKDVDTLTKLGITATCNRDGASADTAKPKWPAEHNEFFKNKDVTILPDNDGPGEAHAQAVYDGVKDFARQLKIVELSGLPYKGDVTDWLERGGDVEILKMLIAADAPAKIKEPVFKRTKAVSPGVASSDEPNVIAAVFHSWMKQRGLILRHHYIDGWSCYERGRYRKLAADKAGDAFFVMRHLKNYLAIGEYTVLVPATKKAAAYKENVPFNKSHKTKTAMANYVSWLLREPGVGLDENQGAPCSLTGQFDVKTCLAVKNGILDWGDVKHVLYEPSPELYTFNYLDYHYIKDAKCDLWDNYLATSTSNNEELITLLEDWLGYVLMVGDTSAQKILYLTGEGGTGKSIYTDVMVGLLGQSNVSAVSLAQFNDKHMLVESHGKLLNICDEHEQEPSARSIEGALKNYTGGGIIQWKAMYGSPFSAYPTAKVTVISNYEIKFKDTSDGMWRRIIAVPYDNIVPEDKKDINLAEKLKSPEQMSGILNSALRGAGRIKRRGFAIPKLCQDLLIDSRKAASPEIRFFEETFCASGKGYILSKDFRQIYHEFCDTEHCGEKSTSKLFMALRKVFPGVGKTVKKLPGESKAVRVITGIRLRDENDEAYGAGMKLEEIKFLTTTFIPGGNNDCLEIETLEKLFSDSELTVEKLFKMFPHAYRTQRCSASVVVGLALKR